MSRELILPVVLALFSLAVSGWASYTNNDKELASRITAVETQQKNDSKGLDRIESKVEKIESKIDQIYGYLVEKKK